MYYILSARYCIPYIVLYIYIHHTLKLKSLSEEQGFFIGLDLSGPRCSQRLLPQVPTFGG